jgi:hypothetical protein
MDSCEVNCLETGVNTVVGLLVLAGGAKRQENTTNGRATAVNVLMPECISMIISLIQFKKFDELGGVVMTEPMKCKYCGDDAIAHNDVFANWRCAWRWRGLELDKLRQRIDAAISRAGQAVQFGLTREGDTLCVFARDLDDVVEILRGNSPTISESSKG